MNEFKKSRKVRNHLVQGVMASERAEIGVDMSVKSDIKVQNNRPDLFILDGYSRDEEAHREVGDHRGVGEKENDRENIDLH
jgi:hypothetical protein